MPEKTDGIVGSMESMMAIMNKEKSTKNTTVPPSFMDGQKNKTSSFRDENRHMKKRVLKKKVRPVPSVKPIGGDMFSIIENKKKTGPPSATNAFSQSKLKGIMKKNKRYQSSSESSGSSGSSMSSGSSGSSGSTGSSGSSGSSRSSGSSGSSTSSGEFNRRIDKEKKRRRDELIHEKVEMLTRIVNLSKDGFTTTKKWNMKDDIDEVRYECYRLQRESNTKNSVEMMRHVLISITTLLEMANTHFNPFNLRLQGLSKNMMGNLPSYDACFVKLHHKYTGKSSVGPEMQVLFTFLSAAVYQHAENAITQKDDSKTKSSNPMSAMMGMMGALGGMGSSAGKNKQGSTKPPPSQPPVTVTPVVNPVTPSGPVTGISPQYGDKPKRKTMRGPGAGSSASIPSSILGAIPSLTIPS